MSCVICKTGKTGMMSARIEDGYICNNCKKNIPVMYHKNLYKYDSYEVEYIISYFKKNKEEYEKTAAYGMLGIDEARGKICINNAVIDCKDIRQIYITCKNPQNINNNVKVSVEFTCEIIRPYIMIKKTIKNNVSCKCEKQGKYISWSEPGDLLMFKTLLGNAIKNSERQNISEINSAKNEIEIIKAKALFMLEDDYTTQDLKGRRNLLVKACHPDNMPEGDYFTKKINEAYEVLKNAKH